MDKVTFTRKQLYDLVWSESMSSLARKYNISDTGLRKICKRMNIPAPKGGYWEKRKWGKPVKIEPYIEDKTVDQKVSLAEKDVESATISAVRILEKRKLEIENDLGLKLQVALRLSNPDELISKTRDYLDGKPGKDYQTGILNASRDQLDIQVSQEFVGRALRFMDTLIKALKARGHQVFVDGWKTYALMYGENSQIAFREKTTRVLVTEGYTHTVLKGTGKLVFRAHVNYNDRFWEDNKQKLEDQISSIIAKLEVDGERRKLEHEEQQKRWDEQKRKEQIELEIRQRKEKEIADFRELIAEAQTWQKLSLLNSYLDEIESKIDRKDQKSEAVTRWLESTRNKATQYDPIEERIKQILSLEN